METDVAAHQSPSLQAEIDEAWAIVYEALTPEQAEAVRLVYHDGLTQEEAAEKYGGIDRTAIAHRLAAAVKQIKQIPGIERTFWFIVTEQNRQGEGQRNRNYAKTLDAMRIARRVKRKAVEKKLPLGKAKFLAHLERIRLLKTERSNDPLFVAAIGEVRQLMEEVGELTARIAEFEKLNDPDELDPVYSRGFDDGFQAAEEQYGHANDECDGDDDYEEVIGEKNDDDYDEEEYEDDDD